MKRFGPYVVDSLLGGGGLARVYRGRDERTNREVAVKVLDRALAADPVAVLRFQREAATLAHLEHPAIVAVLDFGQEGDEHYMVLELLDGESLKDVLTRDAPLSAARAIGFADRILDALAACHAHGVVHRDLKPSNVMVLAGDVVRLIDFGLAKVGPDVGAKLTETGTIHGTPHYMSPEQCRGEDVGAASDIYSVGVLLYEMLAGKTPFAGADAATLMAAHLFVDPPALAGVSDGVAAVVRSALAKRPEDRPSATALRKALQDAMTGTDPITRGALGADLRVDQLTKPREARAVGSAAHSDSAGARGTVTVWMANGPRAASLLGSLGAAGIDVALVESDAPPSGVLVESDAPPSGVLVVSGLDRLRRAKAHDRKSVVVVVDITGPSDTTEAIRLGADDMLLREAPDADLAAKVTRLLKRKARA